jgi:hypothetical protein
MSQRMVERLVGRLVTDEELRLEFTRASGRTARNVPIRPDDPPPSKIFAMIAPCKRLQLRQINRLEVAPVRPELKSKAKRAATV